jgi:IS30 family transposase
MKKNRKRLTLTERKLIATWKLIGTSNKTIAKRLSRDPTTIGREIKRNGWSSDNYEPLHAHNRANYRLMKRSHGKPPLKNSKIYAYVLKRLRQGWSPEQISGRLKKDHPKDDSWHISHETIYAYIYHPDNKGKKLWEYLRRGQKKRRRKTGRKVHRVRIPDRISIHDRPKEVNQRKIPGHWEGDSIVGKGKKTGLHTEYERVTSLIRFERLNGVTADQTLKAMRKIFNPFPKKLKKSTTLDNGLEMTKHSQTGIQAYFADPYASYQRGGNENANLWIRYYFPKKTDFSTISDQDLKVVEWELNNRPRKRLNFSTPQEVFNYYLKGCTST